MVLSILRKKARSTLIYVLFGIITLVFIFYFGWGGIQQKRGAWFVEVNDKQISQTTYSTYYNSLVRLYENIYKDRLTKDMLEQLNLKQKALDSLVANTLFLEAANNLNLSVPEGALRASIQEVAAFRVDGKFDLTTYRNILKLNKMKPQDFEDNQKEELKISWIRNLVRDAAKTSDHEAWQRFMRENEKINLEYVEIDPDATGSDVVVADEEIADYYKKNTEEFRVPEKIKMSYLQFPQNDYENQVAVSDEEVGQYYNDFSEEFWQPRRVRARHILIKASPDATEEGRREARGRVEEILGKIKGGAAFEDLAKQHSQDTATAEKGGDLGYFSRGQMVKSFEEAAFSLGAGETSGVVETKFGFHIIRVDDTQEEGAKPLDSVRETIVRRIVDEKTKELIKKEAYRAYRTLLKSKNFEEYAKTAAVQVHETEYFSQAEGSPLLAGTEGLLREAFSLNPGELLYPFVVGKTYYVAKLVDKEGSRLPELAEAREAIVSILEKRLRREAAKTKAEDLLKKVKAGRTLEDVVAEEHLPIKETGSFARGASTLPALARSVPGIVARAFGLSAESPYPDEIFEGKRLLYLIRLKSKESASEEEFREKKKTLAKDYVLEKREVYSEEWLRQVRSRSNIVYNPDITL